MCSTPSNPALSGSIISTFFYYVVPSTIGLIAITTASMVDGIFVGNILGTEALAAITLMTPYFTFLIALSIMLAVGGSVRAGKYIGENNVSAASTVFSQALITSCFVHSMIALLSLVYEEYLYRLLNIPSSLQPLVSQYFAVMRWVFIIQLFSMVLYYFVRADGHPVLASSALLSGAIINIALDAWFIIYLQAGLAGAAYATGIAQVIQLGMLSRYFFSPQKTLQFSYVSRQWSEILQAAYNGISEFINEISIGLIFLLLNWLLISRLGIDGVAAFSIVNYFIFLSVMLCYGIADALHLLISQNYGAQRYHRINHFLLTAIVSALLVGSLLVAILLLWQQEAISWFLDSDNTHVAVLTAELLLILWPLFLVNGINIVLSSYLTAIQKPKPSAIIALSRSLLLPACLLLVFYFLLDFWQVRLLDLSDESFLIALPLAEWCTFLFAAGLCYRYQSGLSLTK